MLHQRHAVYDNGSGLSGHGRFFGYSFQGGHGDEKGCKCLFGVQTNLCEREERALSLCEEASVAGVAKSVFIKCD